MFIEAKDDGGGGDNWTTGAISRAKLQSNHYHQQTNILFFYRLDVLPVAQPTVSEHWREISHCMDLLTSSSPGGLPSLLLTTNSSWLPWGRVAMPLISPQPSDASTTACSKHWSVLTLKGEISHLHYGTPARRLNSTVLLWQFWNAKTARSRTSQAN